MKESTDFLIERRLASLNPELHSLYRTGVFGVQTLLTNYKNIFPTYTDHSFVHSEQIINFCNQLIGFENIEKLNADEIYILLMAILLHDVGMGISDRDLSDFEATDKAAVKFLKENPNAGKATVVRNFHHELSGYFINKYKSFFDIPTEEHAHCIIQVARGHRKVELLDEKEYSSAYKLPNGNTVCIPYLSALIRLGDELDIGSDRNLLFFYNENDGSVPDDVILIYHSHEVIKTLKINEDNFEFLIEKCSKPVMDIVFETLGKLKKVMIYCKDVIDSRTSFILNQKEIKYSILE